MASTKKKSREELIAGGYCPLCSKCTRGLYLLGIPNGYMLYECQKCGTLLLQISCGLDDNDNDYCRYFDVTENYGEIDAWHERRRREFNEQVGDLEMELRAETRGAIMNILAGRKPDAKITVPPRARKGLALVKSQPDTPTE